MFASTTAAAVAPAAAAESTTTAAVGEAGGRQYDRFLDDPYNMAMYVVLPCMIFVYGGCCFIYCMAKLHRYCRRRARRRANRHLIQKNDDSDNNDDNNHIPTITTTTTAINNNKGKAWQQHRQPSSSVSVVDVIDVEPEPVTQPVRSRPLRQQPPESPVKPVKSARQPAKPAVYLKPASSVMTPSASSVVHSGEGSTVMSSRGVRPAYVRSQDLQEHMKHLDDQLKAAFNLIHTDNPHTKKKSRPDVCPTGSENQRSVSKRPGKAWIQFYVSDQ